MLRYDARSELLLYKQICADYKDVFLHSQPLCAALAKQVFDAPDSLALTDGLRSFTYAQLQKLVFKCAGVLRQHKIMCGMRVVIRMPNSLEFYIWYHAIHAVGAIAVLVPHLLHAREVENIFKQCMPDLVISDFLDSLIILENCGLSSDIFLNLSLADLPAEHEPLRHDAVRLLDDSAVVLYTSGSTGDPRGVVLSARNILTNALQSYTRMLTVDLDCEKFIAALPLSHSFGHMTGLWLPVVSASSVFVMPSISRVGLKEVFNSFKPTIFFGVPALFGALCITRGIFVDSVRLFVSGGDFLPVTIRNAFLHLFGRFICTGYGLSEASPVVGLNIMPDSNAASIITPLLPEIEYKIVSDSPGEASCGELWIKGKNVMQGYFSLADEPSGCIFDGWLATGDVVSRKKDGSLVMVGRLKDIIVFKGFNIYPQEIENILLKHSQVFQCIVVGRPHDVFGEVPVAGVVVRQGVVFDEKRILDDCKNALASYKIPHKIISFNEFPLNHLGKIDRRTVKKTLLC